MIRSLFFLTPVIIVIPIIFVYLSTPQTDNMSDITTLKADLVNGEYIFRASGCSHCHQEPKSTDDLILTGGTAFKSNFGIIYAPNVSMSKQFGIGRWTLIDFAKAVREGVSPKGEHYYPVFPYTSYSKMEDQDLVDLWGFWKTLPSIEYKNKQHKLKWPFSVRENIGLWKIAHFSRKFVGNDDFSRGRYLSEALFHCAECHTPRNIFGGLQKKRWMQGGKNPVSDGTIPNITAPNLKWSSAEISEYLLTGFTPDYDVVGGEMALVIENTSRLTKADRDAISAYINSLD